MTITLDYSSLDDHRLVELHLAGDGAAFRQIVERYQAMICALAVSACGDVARSEDLAQEVFLAAWRQLAELREPAKLRAWLCGIARNIIYGSMRRQQRVPTARAEALSPETPTDEGTPQDHAISAEESALMWRTLEAMPENYREPMVLYYREHRAVPAVAAALEISEDTVRQRLTRGRAMLSERMATIVEETLERGGPGQAFTQTVLAALPAGAGVAGTTAAKAGAMAKAAATAGGVGAALGKGGVGLKLIGVVGVLPALLSGLTGALDFRVRHDAAQTPAARRLITRAYLGLYGGIVVGLVGVALWTWLARGFAQDHVGVFVLGLVLVSAVPTLAGGAWSRRQFRRAAGPTGNENTDARAIWEGAGYEYRSERRLLGLPLVHVRTGPDRRRHGPPVKAWVAVGDVAFGVLFAGGGIAVAPVSMGGITVGLLSFGGMAIGGFAVGGCALGALAVGGMAAGLLAKGGVMYAVFANEHFDHYAGTLLSVSVVAWGLAWLPPLVFVGWHSWRKRGGR